MVCAVNHDSSMALSIVTYLWKFIMRKLSQKQALLKIPGYTDAKVDICDSL